MEQAVDYYRLPSTIVVSIMIPNERAKKPETARIAIPNGDQPENRHGPAEGIERGKSN
jgi:hypothetical protein